MAKICHVERILSDYFGEVDFDFGVTEEGDPWASFADPEDGELHAHITRQRNVVVFDIPQLGLTYEGRTIPEVMGRVVDGTPLEWTSDLVERQFRMHVRMFGGVAAFLLALLGLVGPKRASAETVPQSQSTESLQTATSAARALYSKFNAPWSAFTKVGTALVATVGFAQAQENQATALAGAASDDAPNDTEEPGFQVSASTGDSLSNSGYSHFDAQELAALGDTEALTLKRLGNALGEPSTAVSSSSAPVVGSGGDDHIVGSTSGDVILGGTGNDTVFGGAGDDTIFGDAGDDVLQGEAGNDVIDGGAGDDELFGGVGDDLLLGNTGNDSLHGEAGEDTLDGGSGDDELFGGVGDDQLLGNTGDDKLYGEAGSDTIDGGAGADFGYGDAGNDSMHGFWGSDTMFGGDGADTMNGGTQNDTVHGENGDDHVRGGVGDDFVYGDAGNDTVVGQWGDDFLDGGDGDDVLRGGTEHDFLTGGLGADRLVGDEGNDTLVGDEGADRLFGGAGDDVLYASVDDILYDGGADGETNGDTLHIAASAIDLASGRAYDENLGTRQIIDIENLVVGDGNGIIRGSAEDNFISLGEGSYEVDFSDGGDDTLSGFAFGEELGDTLVLEHHGIRYNFSSAEDLNDFIEALAQDESDESTFTVSERSAVLTLVSKDEADTRTLTFEDLPRINANSDDDHAESHESEEELVLFI
ncbi:MAG: calcium-binding protein [Pseudomonadota bacterium]